MSFFLLMRSGLGCWRARGIVRRSHRGELRQPVGANNNMQDLPPVTTPHPHTAALQGRLLAGENVVATLEVDLDAEGRFAQGLIALTNSRLLAYDPAAAAWTKFPLAPGQSLRLSDHGFRAVMERVGAGTR